MAALLLKVAIFFYSRYSRVHNLRTQLYLLFLFSLSIQNLVEINFFLSNVQGQTAPPDFSGTLYFSSSIFAIAFLLHLAFVMARDRDGKRENLSVLGIALVYAPALLLQVLLWKTTLLVAGFEPMNYTYAKVPGRLYILFQLYAIGYLCASIGLLFYGWQRQRASFYRLQNKLLLVGLAPVVALVTMVIVLQQAGFREFNTTATLPIAITFFLAVTAYATHQYRLFDFEFFVPWSKLRRRKTVFYDRIKSLIAEIADMSSVNAIVQSLSEALRCPVALISGPKPTLSMAGEAFGVARFPASELKKIDQIIVANEIVDTLPATYSLMKRHKVAAIVPFYPHSHAAASWMLLGESFSDEVYSPLDFKNVEYLFARLADRFLDSQLLLRSQLTEAQLEIGALHERLALAWQQIEDLRTKLAVTNDENSFLRKKSANSLNGDLAVVQTETLECAELSQKSFDDHIAEFEVRLIAKTLEYCHDDVARAAELLNLPLTTLYHKLRQYGNS